MRSYSELLEHASRARYEFLVSDAELAITFLSVAKTSGDAERVRRLHGEAQKAHAVIRTFLPTLHVPTREMETLNNLFQYLGSLLRLSQTSKSPS